MKNIYLSATNLYLVKPSVMTYNADNYMKLEQREENIDIAFKEDNRYFSITKEIEYEKPNNQLSFNKYYVDVNDEDKVLLIRYLYENDTLMTDEEEEHIKSLIKYFNLEELIDFINDQKQEFDAIRIQKIKK